MIVIDASALLNALLRRRAHVAIWRRIRTAGSVAAPHLIDVEIGHALRRLLLRGEIDERASNQTLRDVDALQLERYPHFNFLQRALQLRDNATVYDAIYIALAEALAMPLITQDRALARVPNIRTTVEIIG